MIIGFKGKGTKDKIVIDTPFAVIPLQEGIKLYPLDLELIGKPIETLELQKSAVLYNTEPSDVLKKEYIRILKGEPRSEDPAQAEITQETQEK
jgi:hypothetical protein